MAIEQNPAGIESINDAQELVAPADSEKVQANLDFYYGDHWQSTNAWVGPLPEEFATDFDTVEQAIQKGFVSKNVIKETVDRAANGVTGKEPIWDIVPNRPITEEKPITEAEQAQVDEAKHLLQNWMQEKEFSKFISKSVRQTFLAGRATLRLYIPSGFIFNGAMQVNTENPLENLYIDAPSPLAGRVYCDPNSKEKTAVFLGTMGDEDTAEISYLLPEANERGQRITELAFIMGQSNAPEASLVQLDLGGRIPMFEMEMPRLTTDQIVSMQKSMNLNLTMMNRNSVLGGFLERTILNGQLPGHYEEDEDGNRIWVRDEFSIGAGSINEIQGVPVVDENTGNITYSNASIQYKDPVSPQTFLQAVDALYKLTLQECDQLHALISGDAASSGESRRQAVASFFSYLKTPKQEIDKAGKWCLETVLAYAGFLLGDTSKFSNLKVSFNTRLDTGAVPSGELDIVERMVRVGVMALDTARVRLGIDDPQAEKRKIENEAAERRMLAISGITQGDTSVVTGMGLTNVDNNDKTPETDSGAGE